MEDVLTPGFIFILCASVALSIYLGKFIINWWHQIAYRNRLMEAQLILLAEIALKQGSDPKEVETLLKRTQDESGETVKYSLTSHVIGKMELKSKYSQTENPQ